MSTEPDQRQSASELSEDTTGFGVLELRTLKDLLLRPRAALEAWMQSGPTAGGRYARPLRLYLALCGLMTLILFLKGGTSLFGSFPPELLEAFADRAGKSADAFLADADNWVSLTLIPLSCAVYAVVAIPLIRAWDPDDLGWRRGFRATFAYLSAWTVPLLPFTWWSNEQSAAGAAVAFLMFALAWVTFMRMGRGRWYRTAFGGVVKAITLSVLLFMAALIAMIPIFAIAFAGATYIS